MMKNKQDIIFKYHLLQQKVFWKILEKVFITKKLTQCKTSRTLKTDGLEIPDNISKHELLSLDQDNSSCDSLLLQFPIPRAFLLPSPSLPSFTLANRNPSSTQSSTCSSSVSLFCPAQFDPMLLQVLAIPKYMPSQANEIYCQAIFRS